MMDCIFCQIIAGTIPGQKVFEDEHVVGFHDIQPLAQIHWVFVHKKHSQDVIHMDTLAIGEVFAGIQKAAAMSGLVKQGLRIVTNVGDHGGQTVAHTHFHVLGGERLGRFGR